MYRKILLSDVSKMISVPFLGADYEINGLNLCNRKFINKNVLTYISHSKFIRYLNNAEIKCVILTEELYSALDVKTTKQHSFFIVDSPEKVFYDLHSYLFRYTDFYNQELINNISSEASIHHTAFIDDGVVIGRGTVIEPNAVIHKNTIIGNNVVIGSGAVIGAEGFQATFVNEKPNLAKHVGGVRIMDNVFIGSNTTIARSLFEGYTEVGANSKLDANVFIAHNCKIGEDTCIIAGAIMTGSSVLGDKVWLAPNSVILNQVVVSSNSFVGASSLVTKDVPSDTRVFGLPAKKIGK